MEDLNTRLGVLRGASFVQRHPDGALAGCTLTLPQTLDTPLGPLVPQYAEDQARRPQVDAIEFFPDGALRRLPLQEPTPVPTPAGIVPAEMLLFYPSGALRRVFPLYGRCGGYWSWRDELKLAPELDLATPMGRLRLRAMALFFHAGGALASLTFWPGETHELPTPLGRVGVRVGVAWREDGSLRSLEPAAPLVVDTPLGRLTAFDPDPCGVTGDENSLEFAPDGTVQALSTVSHCFRVECGGVARRLVPGRQESACGDGELVPTPLRLEFAPGELRFPGAGKSFSLAECAVTATPHASGPVTLRMACD